MSKRQLTEEQCERFDRLDSQSRASHAAPLHHRLSVTRQIAFLRRNATCCRRLHSAHDSEPLISASHCSTPLQADVSPPDLSATGQSPFGSETLRAVIDNSGLPSLSIIKAQTIKVRSDVGCGLDARSATVDAFSRTMPDQSRAVTDASRVATFMKRAASGLTAQIDHVIQRHRDLPTRTVNIVASCASTMQNLALAPAAACSITSYGNLTR